MAASSEEGNGRDDHRGWMDGAAAQQDRQATADNSWLTLVEADGTVVIGGL